MKYIYFLAHLNNPNFGGVFEGKLLHSFFYIYSPNDTKTFILYMIMLMKLVMIQIYVLV